MVLPEVDTPEEVSAEFQVPDVGPFGCRFCFEYFAVRELYSAVLSRVQQGSSEAGLKGGAVLRLTTRLSSRHQDITGGRTLMSRAGMW